jgi:acetyltransferase-like isoleucine patch superfamily enzyme
VAAGEVRIGGGTVLGERCVLRILSGATVGPGCRLADEVILVDHGPRYEDTERPIRHQGLQARPIVVGTRVRIGSRAVVLGGARVADGVQVGAQSVVRGVVAVDSPDEPPARR